MQQTPFPLHPAQQDVFTDQLINLQSPQYNLGGYIVLRGELNKAKFFETIHSGAEVFDAFRMRFDGDSNNFHGYLDASYTVMEIAEIDFSNRSAEEAKAWMQSRFNVAFEIKKETPLIEQYLIKIAENEHWFFGRYHHLITDGYGFIVWVNYIANKYKSLVGEESVEFVYPSYREEAANSFEYKNSPAYLAEGAYWKEKLTEKPQRLLEKKYADPAPSFQKSSTYQLDLNREQCQLVATLQELTKVGIQQLTIAALLIYFGKTTVQSDFVFGIPVHKRGSRKLRNIVGMFSGILPHKSTYDPDVILTDLLKDIAASQKRDYRHQNYLNGDLTRDLKIPGTEGYLCEVLINYEPLHFDLDFGKAIDAGIFRLANESDRNPLQLCWRDYDIRQALQLQIHYSHNYFSLPEIELLARRLIFIIQQFSGGLHQPIGSFEILPAAEHQLLAHFTSTHAEYPRDKTIVALFEEQVVRTPESIAVVYEDGQLSYKELNAKANRLAHYLRSHGAGADMLIPICMERSIEMIVGILGILKAGSAYVPMDPEYPSERIEYILTDTAATIVVSSKESRLKLPQPGRFEIVEASVASLQNGIYEEANLPAGPEPHNLAYVIYTSGSTGRPKGVLIEHRNVVRLFKTDAPLFDFNDQDVWSLFHSFSFDFSVWEMYGALLYGGRLVIVPAEVTKDVSLFSDLLVKEGVTVLNQTPSAFYNLQQFLTEKAVDLPVRYVIFGGEALTPAKLQPWKGLYPECRLINMYGITETTVHVTYQEIEWKHIHSTGSIIGKPIPTLSIYILDKDQNFVPVEIIGEIYVGGAGLARGYLNRPELTAERFISNPFSEEAGARLYKTGDLGKWLVDGNIEYSGRIDEQVKIRGYRIELGEIETVLEQSRLVKQAVVIAKEDSNGNKRLIGYVVTDETFDKRKATTYLKDKLPEYMVPSLWVQMEALPLTPNGKTDRKALPDADLSEQVSHRYIAPATKAETDVAAVWQEFLNIERIGTDDNFFELGGDSIIAIQVISRLKKQGYFLQPKDIFIHQTIGNLSAVLKDHSGAAVTAEQGLLTGAAGLLPIQQWYFEKKNPVISHYNQSVLLQLDKSILPSVVGQAIMELTGHHDALRFTYYKKEDTWQQEYGLHKAEMVGEDLRSIPDDLIGAAVSERAGIYQRSLNIEKGEIIRVVWMQTPAAEQRNRLLIVIHHLAVDVVSWRILIEDLQHVLNAIITGGNTGLGSKSNSYRQWYGALENYGQSKRLLSQQKYWEEATKSYSPLPVDKATTDIIRVKDTGLVSITLNAAATSRLLGEVPRVYHTEINDVLLAALARSLCDWSKKNKVVVGLEGHGREHLSEESIDISRTVGWFTSLYPVVLAARTGMDAGEWIIEIKEQLRQVPDRGIGYGVLKYINKETSLQGREPWDIVFNYLGQLDNVAKEGTWFSVSDEPAGDSISEEQIVQEKLSVDSRIQGGELVSTWRYSRLHYKEETVKAITGDYLANLELLISHCIEKGENDSVFTPSDFGLGSEISHSELQPFLEETSNGKRRKDEIDGLYRLSSLQQGMLFHGLYEGGREAYMEQFSCDIVGLNPELFKRSWNYLLKKHSVLRSAFYHNVFSIPVQCVYRDVEIKVDIRDYRSLRTEEQKTALKEYEDADLKTGFDFMAPPLMRLGLIRLRDDRYRMVWTSHHILFDGWSLALLMEEFLRTYEQLIPGSELQVKKEDRYEDYIRYLERVDYEPAEKHWRTYLQNIQQATLLPFINATTERIKGIGEYGSVFLKIDAAVTIRLQEYVQQQRITVNTVMQGIWAYLIHSYTGSPDILFGAIVSGRTNEIPDIENRVGMFINTLPLRSNLTAEGAIADWLQQIQVDQVSSRQHQHLPLQEIGALTEVQSELFDTLLVFENYPVSKILSSGEWSLQFENIQLRDQNNFPLTVTIGIAAEVTIDFRYNTSLLQATYVQNIKAHFEHVLLQVIQQKAFQIKDIELLTSQDKQQLHEFNNTTVQDRNTKNVVELFETQVSQNSHSLALVFENREINFKELNERSNKLAHYLKNTGVTKNSLIPICVERSMEMVVAIWGTLKAGGAYVPIDPTFPAERIKYILNDCGAGIVVSSAHSISVFDAIDDIRIIDLDDDLLFMNQPNGNPAIPIEPDNLAYIIYTSGSTGRPKGVMVQHRNLVHYILNLKTDYVRADTKGAGSFMHLSYTFDASLTALFMPLLKGKSIVIGSKDSVDVFEDDNLWKYAPYDFIKLTPAHLELLQPKMELPGGSLLTTTLVVGGEALLLSHVNDLLDKGLPVSVINEYGPTEATVGCSTYTFNTAKKNEALQNGIPIGKPIDNTQLYIVNEAHELVAIGVAGEICIGGAGVAKGYLNKPDLTAEKFIINPFKENAAGTIYKTGDIGRWLPDGNLEYVGRKDHQVKIRGYRIELGEIENILQQSELVKVAAVLSVGDTAENRRLVAYIVPDGYFEQEEILHYLSSRLPDYMIPSVLRELDALPLTSNGKTDRRALAAMETEDILAHQFIAARNEREEKLTEIWQRLLEIDAVGINDDFFELGGHSLLAVRMIAAIRKEFGAELGINEIFDYPTIALMAAKLESLTEKSVQLVVNGISVQNRPALIPLSFSQERLWFIHQLEGSLQYHVPAVLGLHGKLNKEALHKSLAAIINRHEVLRTVIRQKDGKGYQFILAKGDWQLEEVDGSKFEKEEPALQQYINRLIKKPFDLSNDHLIRATLITVNESEHLLVVAMHHIASDAWSTAILVQEFMELYSAYNDGRPVQLPPLPLQYADYAIWQRNYLGDDILNTKLDYWKKKLDGVLPLQLPADYSRPAESSTSGASASFHIPPKLQNQLLQLSKQHGATLYMTMLAAFNVMLYRYSGQQDICVGTSIAGRPQQELEGLIGFFVNTLALRNGVKGDMPFSELLGGVRTTMLEAYAHQEVPFEKVVEAVIKDRDMSRNPLFQVMLVLRNTPEVPELVLGNLVVSQEPYEFTTVKFDLTFFLTETPQGLEGNVLYSTDLFKKDRIEQMMEHFVVLLQSVIAAPDHEVGTLKMLSVKEENKLKKGFSVSKASPLENSTVVTLFEKQALRWPKSIAVSFEGTDISYGELNERANRLAHYLCNCGVKEDTLVPLFVDRGPEMITGIMGILKAGGAYVPVDTGLPQDRIRFMLQDTAAPVVVCSKSTREKLLAFETDVVEIDGAVLHDGPKQNGTTTPAAHHLVYVIYTSGSTGQPKGVMVTHGNLADYVQGLDERTGINSCSSFALVSSISTDLGNTVLFSSLISGGTLHVFSKEAVSNVEGLHHYFQKHYIDCVKIVPSHWKALMMDGEPLLPRRLLVFGGESLQPEQVTLIRESGRNCRVVNHYGPTETTVGKLLYEVDIHQEYEGTIPIGRPFGHNRIYVLSADLSLCPAGVPGQLYIGGAGVARGYLNNEKLTAEKFVTDPFDKTTGLIFYKTGDLVKYNTDGEILFLGRIDDQVKIRGYRVEPGEVERILSQSERVKQAVVLAKDDSQGNKRLIGYLVAEGYFDKESILEYLQEKLPDYMIPALLVPLEKMPLTNNGKIDRQALPDPEALIQSGDKHVAPRTELEQQLVLIWEEVLEVEGIGVHDNFFELGGHSLLAVRLISAIRKGFNAEVSIGAVFDYPTIAELAEQLSLPTDATAETLPPITVVHPRPVQIPLSFSQERLWFIDQMDGSVQYHVPAVLRLNGKLDLKAFSDSLQEIVNRHEVLRTVIKDDNGKPYQHINEQGGWKLNIIEGEKFSQDKVALQKRIEKLIHHPYDLSKDDLLRAHVFTFGETDNLVVLVLHHIASDGWSKAVLVKELVELYSYFAAGRKTTLLPLPVQYADYAIWQRAHLQGKIFDEKLGYWKKKLDGVALVQLPTDFKRPAVWTNRGAMTAFNIDGSLLKLLQEFSHQQGVTLFMSLLTAFKVLMYRYSGQQDICVGTPVAGRSQTELEGLIGFFVNTLALRTEVAGNLSFSQLLQKVKETTMEAFAHQEIPFEKVVDAVVDERDLSRNPIFQVMFILRNTPEIPVLRLGDVTMSVEDFGHQTSMFDIALFVTETNAGFDCTLEYNTDLFREETMAGFIRHYQKLLESITDNPAAEIALLPILDKAEAEQVLVTFNSTAADYTTDGTFITLIEDQVVKTPDAVAIIFEQEQLTYHQLNSRANQLAHYLRSRGVQPEMLVPVCMSRNPDMIVAMLGILKAGGAYVPIDPEYPAERIQFMLEDTAAAILITSKVDRQHLPTDYAGSIIEIDSQWPEIQKFPEINLPAAALHQLAYIIYTSGSTGRPKGVMIEHRSVYAFICWCRDEFKQSFFDVAYATTSICFDLSVFEIFYPLSIGRRLRIIENGLHIYKYLPEDTNILINTVPSVVDNLVKEGVDFSHVCIINMAGEPVPVHLLQSLDTERIEVRNLYGPSEDTTYSTVYRLQKGKPVLIGKPISNTRIYIIDSHLNAVPVGIAGEICIAGEGLARGYLNQANLTSEKFILNSFDTNGNSVMYKTGDLGKWLPDGNIDYLGRVDNQVKMRGFRIELGEIETVLNALEPVENSCIIVKYQDGNAARLVAYYVPEPAVVKAKESELYLQQVDSWKAIYENEYVLEETAELVDPEFNIIGWNDSFTNGPIPAGQMKEWVNDIVAIILADKPERVLEIGCGTGLIYYPLADKLKKYTGTDFSQHSISQIRERISKGERAYCPTELVVAAAHEIALDEGETVDTIIINSVAQYFPGDGYLGRVIEKSISLLPGKGRIIIGDVRDYRLLPAFKGRLLLQKLQGNVSIKEYNWAVEQDVLNEEELCFSPEYFYGLQQQYPQITHVDIQWKKGDYINELSLYRYNVVLYVGIEKEVSHPQWQSWNNGAASQVAMQQFGAMQEIVALKDVPNLRLWKERLLQQSLQDSAVTKVDDMKGTLNAGKDSVQVTELLKTAEANGYWYKLLLDEYPLLMNIVFERNASPHFIEPVYSEKDPKPSSPKTNIPLFADISLLMQKDIKALLRGKLPDYMVPAEWVALGKLPLTVNGKLDRKFLGEREDKILSNQLNYAPPRNEWEEKLAAIWEEFLHLEKAGIHENFFELGGHSLMAMRVISSIRRQLNLELAIKDLFLYPTIAELSVHLQSLQKGAVLPAIEKQQWPEQVPLSFSQERLWFIDKLGGSVHYHMPSVLRLKGRLHIKLLQDVLGAIVQRQEILRTVILESNGQGYQKLLRADGWRLHVTDGLAFKSEDDLAQYIQTVIDTPFNLSADYLFRAHLIALGEKEHLLVATMHHIATDGWSTSILVNEVAELYKAISENRPPDLSPLPIQYSDYAIWQRSYLSGEVLERKLAYWKEKLAGVAPLQLPLDYPRPPVWSGRGSTRKFMVNSKLTAALKRTSQEQESTLFMTLLAALNVLLHRYSGQNDICVGTTIGNRPQQELEGLIGFFINTLALRTEVREDSSFIDLLQGVKNTTLEAYEHQELPFEKVVDTVAKERDMSRNPVFGVLFTMQNTPEVPQLHFGEIALTREETVYTSSRLDITFTVAESENGLQFFVEYATDLFNEGTILRMIGHYKELLKSIVAVPNQTVGNLCMITAAEQYQLLTEFNDSFAPQTNTSLIALIEEQVTKAPQALALVFGNQQLTYQDLNTQSNQLAHYLLKKGIKAESIVPVLLIRSLDMMVVILAILKAGGAYVPIDPQYPAERIAYMLDDMNAGLVICNATTVNSLSVAGNHCTLDIDHERSLIHAQPLTNPDVIIKPHHLAYIIYTSGSTGRPKGVMIQHAALGNYLLNNKTRYVNRNTANAGSFIHLSYTFDASLTAMFMPLLCGKSIVISSSHSMDMFDDANFHQYAPYDFIKLTPSHLDLLGPVFKKGDGKSVTQKLVVGGEALRRSHFASFIENDLEVEVVNEYGPTEATVGCSTYTFRIPADSEKIKNSISIGKPIDNVQLYVLNVQNELLPTGVAGEICIGGAGLARGYLNLPGLTAEKFIPHPFSSEEGAMIYKTGDVGRWLADGTLEYLGRRDEQVKIRGYRIELGEIENVLGGADGMRQCVVLAKEDGQGRNHLIAYVVPGEGFNLEAVIAFGKERLPEYMVPLRWVALDSLPLITSGKVDKKALPDPERSEAASEAYVSPRSEAEEKLVQIWQELLDVETVGIHDNFFELGGDSILAIQLVSRARNAGYEMKVEDVFTYQKIADLAAMLGQGSGKSSGAQDDQGYLTGTSGLLPIQQWFFETKQTAISHFNQSVLLTIDKQITAAALAQAAEQIAIQHDALRFTYTHTDGHWQQEYGTTIPTVITEDLRSLQPGTLSTQMKQLADGYQRSLDIEKGDLMRVVWIQTPSEERANRLLIIIHHLAIDGVSWRILLEDLERQLTVFNNNRQPEAGYKTTSYRRWYQALENYGRSNQLLAQKAYWNRAVNSFQPIVTDTSYNGKVTADETGEFSVRLRSTQTRRLLQEIPRVYHTEINDILLCAFVKTLCEWGNRDEVVIGMEGHGRENIEDEIDISRTVGWFTTLYPLLLQTGAAKGLDDLIKTVKEQLRRVPDKGLGYGVLKYINRDETLQNREAWDIQFNYLGQLDNVVRESKWLAVAEESPGVGRSEEYEVSDKLSVNSHIRGGELVMHWSYSTLHYREETIRNLAADYIEQLELLIEHCIQQGKTGSVYTPSDYGLGSDISFGELDAFLEEDNSDNIMSF